ncbi:hypothetical protein Clacol_001062 [Clathrus columnatus]|uniref:Uncharacterized protein n=1 Tax=Clathrus columnatus TaxID=1419009 RepID=A0AAV5A1H8_9AGAM|nr:hypothetical protein Clacol_001062 [Clathrus columnatus]
MTLPAQAGTKGKGNDRLPYYNYNEGANKPQETTFIIIEYNRQLKRKVTASPIVLPPKIANTFDPEDPFLISDLNLVVKNTT